VNSRLPASAAAVLLALLPPVALVTAWLWLGVVPRPVAVIGGLISLAGVLLVTLRGQEAAVALADVAPAAAD
jgi:drug/metabolite transporter (DMT)-like permease